MPAHKKDPSTRRRRNKVSTAATLTRSKDRHLEVAAEYAAMTVAQLKLEIDDRNEGRPIEARISKRGRKAELVKRLQEADANVPALPERMQSWHPMTHDWWADIWASPMSNEWDDSDLHNLVVLAAIYDDIWRAENAKDRKDAATEYRLQRADLGLSPYSRRRLEWQIESADEARDRGNRRRGGHGSGQGKTPAGGKAAAKDPRAALSLVK